jgi:hypothetical protein
MPECHQSVVVTAFFLGLSLLLQFNQDIALPKWLAPFSLSGLLALLMIILPWMQKGSVLAFVVGYLAIGFLVINLVILFTLAHLPGQTIKLSSASHQAGTILIGVLGIGLSLLLKSLGRCLGQAVAQLGLWVLRAWTSHRSASHPVLQKRLEHGIAWG